MKLTAIILMTALCLPTCLTMAEEGGAKMRVGVFSEEGFPGGAGIRPSAWYQDELKKQGCEAVVLNAADMSNSDRLDRKALDVLILPNGENIPYEAAYLIPKFLAEGGHLVTTRLPWNGYISDPAGTSKWTKATITWRYPMDWQIRFLPWKSAQRSLKAELKINTNLMASVSARLPATAGPLKGSMGLPDRLNMFTSCIVNGTNENRDFTCGGDNMETAANIILPVYCLPSGEPTDFLAYRYHNNYYNGGTLVHLGQVGESLMKGDKAGDILWSCLRLCAEKYPGEQSAEWYGRLLGVQRKTSEYGKVFVDAFYKARDGMTAAFYAGKKEAYYGTETRMRGLMKGLEAVIKEKQALDKLMVDGTDMTGQDFRRTALLGRIEMEKERCAETVTAVDRLPVAIKEPKKVEVRHELGGIPVEAGITYIGLYGLRTDMLQTMKELGCNVWTFQWHAFLPFMESPLAKSLMEGVRIQIRTGHFKEVCIEQGILDVLTGQVKETPRETRRPENLEGSIRCLTENWKSFPMIRYWGGTEGGLRCSYWGEQAREEYITHLKEKYGKISRLNERWLTALTNFNDIKLITRQPETESEHANWEDWRKFRELQLFKSYEAGYRLFKKYAPNTLYGSCISTGSRNYPMYGVDYYELSKAQDILATDGTAIPVGFEWVYLDLIADGKKVWTMEWGAFYNPPADILDGRKTLRGQLWQEVSGGHIGINCWFWRWPGFRANYVDTTGLPTQYGWELKQLVSDFRKFEHILLDGKRADPEVRILFSNTTKSHDQAWKPRGAGGTFSLHQTVVDSLYGRFMKLHLSARVLDEGALRDGADLSKCRLLIVPQAQYLSREIQDKLLDYARAGGCLVIEGLSGKYDNYGNSSNNMFRALGVVPGTVRAKESQLPDDVTYLTRNKRYEEQFYAPMAVEGGKTMLKYVSGEPALVSMELGKGKVVVSGLPFSLEQTGMSSTDGKALSLIMGEIFKETDYMPKYQCNDEALVLREWEYENELYLVCAYPAGKELANQFEMKVRGNWEVEDYMLGVKVPVKQDGTYTRFEGVILSPGGRVYRLKSRIMSKPVVPVLSTTEGNETEAVEVPANGRQNKAIINRIKTDQPKISDDKNKSLQANQQRKLPYKGEIQQQDGEIEMEGYKLRVAVVSGHGEWIEKGKVFLTVQRGDEERKQELKVGENALYIFRDEALKVKCEAHSYNYPEGATVAIDAIERPKLESVCVGITNGDEKELSNGMISLKVLPDKGGKIVELKTYPEGINNIAQGGIKEMDSRWPGNLINQHFAVESETTTTNDYCLVLGMENVTSEGLRERKELHLKKGMAWVGVNIELRNEADGMWEGLFMMHPELNIGGMADNDTFYVPEKNGISAIQYGSGAYTLNPAEGWAACCDTQERLAYVSKFNLNEVKTVYLWFDTSFYTMELWSREGIQLKSGESLRMNHEIYIVKGVSGVGGFNGGWVGNLIIPAGKWHQSRKMKVILELGNASLEKQSVQIRVALRQGSKEVRTYYDGKADVSYEGGLGKEIEASFEGLAVGDYELGAQIEKDTGTILTIRKNISLFGKKLEDDRAACADYQQRLDAYKNNQKVTMEEKFNATQIFEELKAAVERQDDETIRQKYEALERILDRSVKI